MVYAYGVAQPLVEFPVLGRPVPQGQVRHLGKGRPSIYGNADILLPWRNHVQACAQMAICRSTFFPILEAVGVHLIFTMPKPKSAPKRKITFPVTRPDLDKIVRTVFDAITDAGVIKDDSQIVSLMTQKVFPGETPSSLPAPGVRITVYGISAVSLPEDPLEGGSGDEGWNGDGVLRTLPETDVPRPENCTCHRAPAPWLPQEPLPVPGQ